MAGPIPPRPADHEEGLITTPRLRLELITLRRARQAVRDRAALAEELGAILPDEWPNEEFRPVLPLLIQEWEVTGGSDGWTWMILSREPDIAVGTLGTKGGPDPSGAVEIGYGLIPSARGRGWMTEAVRAMLEELREVGVRRVTAETEPENTPSHRVLERCGFAREADAGGMWRWARSIEPTPAR